MLPKSHAKRTQSLLSNHSRNHLQRPDWLIRPLSPNDDLDEITDLIHAAYAPHLANDLRFVGTSQTIEDTVQRFASGHGFVATVDQVLVGTILARPPQPQSTAPLYRHPSTWSFGQFAVAPKLRGRGLGRALHDKALQFAGSNGAKVMALDTAAPARRLIELYERWGYRIVGVVDWRPRTNYSSVLMTRSIES